jgi:hypothetical protein
MPRHVIERRGTRASPARWIGFWWGVLQYHHHLLLHKRDIQCILHMALPLKAGLTPAEVAFLCEMETVTVIPRHRLESLELLGVSHASQPKVQQGLPS